MKLEYKVYRDKKEKWRWRLWLIAGIDRYKVARSCGGFDNFTKCLDALEYVLESCDAPIYQFNKKHKPLYEISLDSNDHWVRERVRP